jgi:basic membrane protein A and related proteins
MPVATIASGARRRPKAGWPDVAGALAALLLVAALAPPALAEGPLGGPPPGKGPAPVIGLVTEGPLNDGGYNQAAWEGVQAGADAIGGRAVVLVPRTSSAYEKDIQRLARRADVVVTVGFTIADATLAVALANPDVQFLGLDEWFDSPPANLQGLDFDRAQAGFLAGIVAAWMTESGAVGAVGGMDTIPAVWAYMNGYRNGAAWLGTGVGYVRNYAGSFNDPEAGAASAAALIALDADVVFGVAGGTNAGIIAAACDADVWAIGVDVDQYLQLPSLQACILTSAENRLAQATSEAIQRWFDGRPGFQGGIYLNDVPNGGVGLAPIRNLTVPSSLQAALDAASAGLDAGSIDPCLPTACDTQ